MSSNIFIFLAGWASTLSGVALGGWLVYRTKRDPYDPLFLGPGKGDSFNLDDGFDQGASDVGPVTPDAIKTSSEAFLQQFADSLTEKAAK